MINAGKLYKGVDFKAIRKPILGDRKAIEAKYPEPCPDYHKAIAALIKYKKWLNEVEACKKFKVTKNMQRKLDKRFMYFLSKAPAWIGSPE